MCAALQHYIVIVLGIALWRFVGPYRFALLERITMCLPHNTGCKLRCVYCVVVVYTTGGGLRQELMTLS